VTDLIFGAFIFHQNKDTKMINKEYTRDLILDFIVEGYSLDMIAEMLTLTKETILRIMQE